VFDDVPVLSPLFLEGEGAAAGLAKFFFAWSGAVGFGFSVGHYSYHCIGLSGSLDPKCCSVSIGLAASARAMNNKM
jgi:hypothetical protein